MATLKVFTRCSGEIVELSQACYAPLLYAARWTKYEGQIRFVRSISASHSIEPKNNVGWEQTSKGRWLRYDYLGGICPKCGSMHFAERQIERPARPSMHECGGRCMSAKGPQCECSCGGKNHGCQ